MSVKVSTDLKDAWGQEIFLGDLVVDIAVGGWARSVPDVVTRVGAAGNFQKNGAGYSKPDNNVVVTAQYVSFKGQAAHEKLLDRYPISFDPVKKKNPAILHAVITQSYCKSPSERKFVVLRWEDSDNGTKERNSIIPQLKWNGHNFLRINTHRFSPATPAAEFNYSEKNGILSGKKLKELGDLVEVDFSLWYNMEITDPTTVNQLMKFV